MRDLKRNQRPFYYATIIGTEPIYDEYGNDTLETRTVWGNPILLKANISANIGEEAVVIYARPMLSPRDGENPPLVTIPIL